MRRTDSSVKLTYQIVPYDWPKEFNPIYGRHKREGSTNALKCHLDFAVGSPNDAVKTVPNGGF